MEYTYYGADGYNETKTFNPLEFGISIIECADWITPLAYLLAGYTVVLFQTDSLEEACLYHITWRMRGINCVLYGNDFMGYFILGKEK